MTIDWAWIQAHWVFLACLAGVAVYYWMAKNPLAGYKLPAITVKLTDEQVEQLRPKV